MFDSGGMLEYNYINYCKYCNFLDNFNDLEYEDMFRYIIWNRYDNSIRRCCRYAWMRYMEGYKVTI